MSFAHFIIGFLCCCSIIVELESSFYIVGSSPLLDRCFAYIYFQTVGCLFILLIGSFTAQRLLNFDEVQFTFSFMDCASGIISNNLRALGADDFLLFYSASFVVLLLHLNLLKYDTYVVLVLHLNP